MMNKKSHRNNLIGLHIFNNLIIRRRWQRSRHSFLPLLSATCGCMLLLCASLSSLRLPLNTSRAMHIAAAEMKTEPNRYLLIETSGGMNQQRAGITDAVVAAYILNATLVVPKLDQDSFWKDSSNFSDIFNVDWFVSTSLKTSRSYNRYPKRQGTSEMLAFLGNATQDATKRASCLCSTKSALSNWLDQDLQKLRCRVNYHALRFADPILQMGRKLVDRMRMKSNQFVALHLRYEPDMLAFSSCYYGGGEKEMQELSALRKRQRIRKEKEGKENAY
ncbi:hypothetical protein SASPL_135890 [Salvia splendens]|uniref:O-fucosyltransferase family protein n=1 Tax=Salvia splendens TaxID=180675 RepID=A0A8X8ZFW9_SALSN|nr:hypothetical protein SASPL_135890 [Salvia splendens]